MGRNKGRLLSAIAIRLPLGAKALAWVLISLLAAVLLALLDVAYQVSGNTYPPDTGYPVTLGQVSLVFQTADTPVQSPEQVLARNDWVPTTLPLSQGWHKDTLWARMQLSNTSALAQSVWLEVSPPRLNKVWLHTMGPDELWESHASGAMVSSDNRPLNMANLVFPLTLAAGEQHTVLVEVSSPTTSLNIGLAVFPGAVYPGIAARTGMQDAAFMGGLLVLGLVSLILGGMHRERTLLLLAARIMAICVWQMQQQGVMALVLPAPTVALLAGQTQLMASCVQVLTTAFTWSFLSNAKLSPSVHRSYGLLLSITVLVALLNAMGLIDTTVFAMLTIYVSLGTQLFTCLLSIWLIVKGHLLAVVMLTGSALTLIFNTQVFLIALGGSGGHVVRTFISPVPALITSTVLLLGAVMHLVREQQKFHAALQEGQQQALARLEQQVVLRTSELVVARDEALQANQAKSVFLAKVSHELRTPMHAVLGYVDLALREPMAPVVAQKIRSARMAGQQLVGQINDLLDYARMEREPFKLEPDSTAVHAFAAQLKERTSLLAAQRGNQFELVLDPALPPWVWVDAHRLTQVLMVLLNNAVRYTRSGHIRLRIGIALDMALGEQLALRFEVEDTGRGITPQALTQIFQAFERGNSQDSDGMGLGLPIAQQLLGLMGSQLEVTSQPGKGSQFSFTLVVQSVDEPPMMASPTDTLVTGYEGRTRQVLVLDDYPANRRYLEELLGDLGFEVHLFSHGAAALAHLQSATTALDLCIVDQRLEGAETGWDWVRALRSAQRDCQVLMLSATEALPPPGWDLTRGIDRHLLKPVDQALLLSTVGELMGLEWRTNPRTSQAPSVDVTVESPNSPPMDAWAALLAVANRGALSALDNWVLAHPGLYADHPPLQALVQALHFKGLADYAKDQCSRSSV